MNDEFPPFELPEEPALDPAMLESMRTSVEESVKKETGALATLRAWPTLRRRALFLAAILGVTAFGLIRGWAHPAIALGLCFAASAIAWLSLRPLHQPALPRWVELMVPAAAIGGVVILALLTSGPQVPFVNHLRCFAPGMATATAVLIAWRMVSRSTVGFHALAAAAAAGLAANAFLAGGCALLGPQHLLAGHASVILILVVGVWITDRLRRSV
ncbi:MAG: hypothetical protein AAGE52_02240 [Myxococcota bacterium]